MQIVHVRAPVGRLDLHISPLNNGREINGMTTRDEWNGCTLCVYTRRRWSLVRNICSGGREEIGGLVWLAIIIRISAHSSSYPSSQDGIELPLSLKGISQCMHAVISFKIYPSTTPLSVRPIPFNGNNSNRKVKQRLSIHRVWRLIWKSSIYLLLIRQIMKV